MANLSHTPAPNKGVKSLPDSPYIDIGWIPPLPATQVGLGNVDNLKQLPFSYLDIDGTLAANSDEKVPSQKAIRTYVGVAVPQSIATTAIPTFAGLICPAIKPVADSVSAIQIQNAAGANVLNIDTTNGRIGVLTATPATGLQVVDTAVTSPRGIMSSQYNSGTDGARFHLRKGRGTLASPTTVLTGDTLGKIVASGYDGAAYQEMAAIAISAAGTVAAARVPTRISISTATDAFPSVLTERVVIDQAGNVGFGVANPTAQITQQSMATQETAVLGAEQTDANNWTSADWTGNYGSGFTHTPGNATQLSRTMTNAIGNLYQVAFTVTGRTAGNFVVILGGTNSIRTFSTNGSYTFGPKITSTNGPLIFFPSSDFDGAISAISVKQITGTYSPVYALNDNSGTSMMEIRSSANALGNQFIGKGSGRYNTTGNGNAAYGNGALYNNTTGATNTANGYGSLYYNTTGYNNVANGATALYNNSTGATNVANGMIALFTNTTGFSNVANGYAALYANTSGYYNAANGMNALYANNVGYGNVANGMNAAYFNTSGYYNTANGSAALYNNTTGYYNVADGYNAGRYIADGATSNQTSNNSVYLGISTRALADGGTNEIVIGATAIGNGSNSVTLGNSAITKTVLQGSVGIGTPSPGAKLHVIGGLASAYLDCAASGTTGITDAGGVIVSNVNATANNWAGILFSDASGGAASAMIAAKYTDRTNHYGDLGFLTHGSDGYIERMRITNTGLVGILTNAPTVGCDINSNVLRLRTAKTPANAGDTGDAGSHCWDANYLYICVATNTWRRIAHASW